MSTHDEPRSSLLRTTTSCEKSPCIAAFQSHDEQAQVQSKRPPVDGNGAAEPIVPGSLNDNSTPAMYLDDYTLAAVLHKNTTSMSSDRSSTITISSPMNSPSSPVKPSFRISLPSGLSLLGLAVDGSFDRPAPSINLPALTPPEEFSTPSWRVSSTRHGSLPVDRTPPLDITLTAEPESVSNPTPSGTIVVSDGMESVEQPDDVLTASIKLAVEKLVATSAYPRTVRAVHQLSPSPITDDDEEAPVSVLRSILAHLLPAEANENWVFLVHAIPEKYPAKNVIPSPATTPSASTSPGEGQDYFSFQNVVNSAVVLCERESFSSCSAAPVSLSPVLASTPYSIDISLYQRIIPPSTAKEARDLFEAGMPSALVDRLTELAPSGRLIFVYPTQVGALTFQREYLDRALAPITRSVIFGKGLPSEACAAVANSGAVEAIPAFSEMRTRLEAVLANMAARSDGRRPSSWSILSSDTHRVKLPRKVWQQWWVLQETSRVRAVMDYYFRQLSRHTFYRDERFTANELARQIMQDLVARYHEERERPPIEVGVFVIERNT